MCHADLQSLHATVYTSPALHATSTRSWVLQPTFAQNGTTILRQLLAASNLRMHIAEILKRLLALNLAGGRG
jgi:hypothetical protein